MFSLDKIIEIGGNLIYAAQGLMALWGTYSLLVVWRRASAFNFRNELQQNEFPKALEVPLISNDYKEATRICEESPRAVARLAHLALANRNLGVVKLRQLVIDRFQRDVLQDMEFRLGWVNMTIKSEPMLGLFGTVLGMMGAFGELYRGDKMDPTQLARDISLALVTTAVGLAIAIPLMVAVAAAVVKIRKMEDLVSLGLNQFFDMVRPAMAATNVATPNVASTVSAPADTGPAKPPVAAVR